MVRLLRMVAVTCMMIALTGCGTAAVAGRPFGNADLIKDVTGQLTQADGIAYTASFALANNTTVSIVHATNPIQTAYQFPGGMVLLLPDRTTSCKIYKMTAKCAEGGPVPPGSIASSVVDGTIEKGGLIRPETVIALLNRTALNADARIAETSRTLAGVNATCISVTGVPASEAFSACVTADGLLGEFAGVVSGVHLNLVLNRFLMTTDSAAFTLPKGATS